MKIRRDARHAGRLSAGSFSFRIEWLYRWSSATQDAETTDERYVGGSRWDVDPSFDADWTSPLRCK